ncbi:MAG: PKD domain-containing protein, partial [Bacteroidia bacterium]
MGVWVLGVLSAQAPPNDNCINASLVAVGGSSGYEYGTYYSDTVQITNATLQAGEYIPPLVPNGKTVWYKFFLPTTRSVRIVLREDGISIDPTKAGWTLYYTNACLPNATHKVDPPIVQMEGYTHECLRRGWYLVQVGSDLAVTGKVFLEIITQPSSAPEAIYDLLAHAQNLGMLSTSHNILIKDVSWEAGCQGLHQGERICDNTLPRDSTWSKSSWHVFRTDGWIDWLGIRLEETPWDNTNSNPRTWRINLYKGDARTDSAGLILVDSCINLMQYTSGVPAERDYMCLLEPNTWYSIQILYPTTYFGNMRLRLYERGIGPTASPNPNTIPSTHNLGTLGFGTYNFSDVLACNARIALNRCGTIAGADTIDGYDLNLWYKFTLSAAVDVRFQYSIPWWWGGPTLRFRLFSGDPAVDGCNLPLVGQWDGGNYLYRCLPAGTYVVQVLGRINRPYAWNSGSNLGVPINFSVQVLSTPQQLFGLHSPTEVNVINGGSPLVSGTTYWVTRDTFDCRTTVLPAGDVCGAANNRASYRIVEIGQNGILSVGDEENCWDLRLRIYRGDARTEPIVGGRIQNLVDQVGCQGPCWWEPVKVCVTPGTYTLVTFGDEGDVGRTTRYWVRFDAFPPTLFTDPLATDPNPPENMGTLSLSNPSISATPTRFSCIDNPNTILGYAPCYGATKLIYREVYIAQPSLVTFIDQTSRHPNIWGDGSVVYRTFRGRISNNTLTSLYKDCHGGFTACMEPGWYTIVAYGYTGGTYTNPTYTSGRGGVIGNLNQFTISMDTRVQKFGTFATADRSYSGDPGRDSIRWYNTGTVTVPLNHKSYGFDWEFWPCANNLPFPPGITSCNPSDNRISYRVFQLTRPSYLIINGSGYYSSMRLYQGDITQSAPPYTIIHDCAGSPMRICWLPPGMYTLVTFASDAHIGQTFTPSIYVDSVGYSLHDWANAAYDFGEIPPDNTEYRTAPLGSPDPLGRPGSTDFIFCTTTAHPSNPSSNCPLGGNWPAVPYPFPDNLAGDYRRNLWYTFTVTGPGRIYVTVQNKTSGGAQPAFSVYESDDVNFPTVVDSTIPSGLSVVATSQIPLRCCDQYTTVSFYREPCTPQPKKRYYIVVNRNTCGKEPNLQIEVGIRFEPVPSYFVKYDHYSTANEISGNPTLICDAPYPGGTLAAGTYTGCQGDLTCATKDPTDQNTCGIRTLWYKFTSDITGYVYLNYDRVGVENYRYNPDDIQLYVQLVPGDSTSSGLARVPLTDGWYVHPDLGNRRWGRGCVHKGQTYYIMLTGCNHLGYVVPRIWLEPHTGDFCTDSVLISVTGTGTYSVQRIIDCFTIGEAPGENDTLVGCMGSPIGQKTMWVLVHNQTLDTMDFDIEIIENTTALGPQIKYRVLSGDCSAMNQEECVKEGAYIILHLKCRPPMQSFWVQVMLPNWARGDIEVKVTANPISRTCRPVNPDCPIARFDQIVGCPDQPVQFLNYSSIGPGISYWWDFGDGFTSNLFAPQHLYALPDTYMVTLIVSNGSCNDTSQRFLIVYPKPTVSVTYTPASPVWVGVPISFTPTYTDTALGSNTIYWDFCAGNVGAPPWCPTCGASLVDYTGSTPPAVSYACPGKKKICVQLNNAGICDTMFCFEVDVVFPPIYAGGPYDGAAEGASYASCATLSYVGGPYDGAA